MTNPFAPAAPPSTTDAPAVAPAPVYEAPVYQAPAQTAAPVEPAPPAPKPEAPKNLGLGDPFAAPKGIGDGERITEFVDRLMLVKPTEYIKEMNTTQGRTEAVRIDMAVLDDPVEPGKIVRGVLLFQQALRREAKQILDDHKVPYLLGRLNKGKTGGGNTLYTFLEASPAEEDLARKWLSMGGEL